MSLQATKHATQIRVLIADDHPIVIDGLRLHAKAHGLELVGEVNDPAHFEELFLQQTPQVVVLDINFGPGRQGGLDLCKLALKHDPGVKIVFYSQFDQIELISEAYRYGAHCYLTKHNPPKILAAAIRSVVETGRIFPDGLAERLASALADGGTSPRQILDARCLAVFTMVAKGMAQEDIAKELNVSLRTITSDIGTIKERTGLQRTTEWSMLAMRYQLISV
jgi:DNA-binding NarL/FixJ family response regulator